MNTQDLTDELCDLYRALVRNLNPQAGTSDGSSHAKPGSRPPIVVAVSDRRTELDQLAEKIAKAARSSLGFQHYKPRTIRRSTTAWHVTRYVCQVETVETVDYATIATLRALPALLEALPTPGSRRDLQDLHHLRRKIRVTLGIDKPPMLLEAACPECHGWTIPLAQPQTTLLADVDEARVWCSNKQCGYTCENPACWCAVPEQPGHPLIWTHTDLLRLSRLLETA